MMSDMRHERHARWLRPIGTPPPLQGALQLVVNGVVAEDLPQRLTALGFNASIKPV